MSRWQLKDTPALSIESNLRLPQTPKRQQSKDQPALSSFAKLAMAETSILSEGIEKNGKIRSYQRRKSISLNLPTSHHPFFLGNADGELLIGSQDYAPPKPQRIGSFVKQPKGAPRQGRRRSRSMDQLFFSAKEDFPPPQPQRISSRKNESVQSGRDDARYQLTRYRSLDLDMDLDSWMGSEFERYSIIQQQKNPSRHSRQERRRSRSMDNHFFFSAKADSPPPQPLRRVSSRENESFRNDGDYVGHQHIRSRSLDLYMDIESWTGPAFERYSITQQQKTPALRGRMGARTKDNQFCFSVKADSPPPQPLRRVSSRKNEESFQYGGDHHAGRQHVRSRSLDLDLDTDIDSLMGSPPEWNRDNGQPSPFCAVSHSPPDRAAFNETKPKKSRTNRKANIQRGRSRSLDLTFDFNLLDVPQCENSRGPCQPTSLKRFVSEGTPAEKAKTRSRSPARGQISYRPQDLDLQPNLSDRQKNPSQRQPTHHTKNQMRSSDHQRGSMWIIPLFEELQDMKRISSLTVDDDSHRRQHTPARWIIPSFSELKEMKRISSLTMDDGSVRYQHARASMWIIPSYSELQEMKRISCITMDDEPLRHQHTAFAIDSEFDPTTGTPKHSGQCLEELNRLPQTLLGKPTEERSISELMESPESALPPPPPTSPKSKYTPPSPLCDPDVPSKSSPNRTGTHKKQNKQKLSPFASEALGFSSYGPKPSRREESKEASPPPLAVKGIRIETCPTCGCCLKGQCNENVNGGKVMQGMPSGPCNYPNQQKPVKCPFDDVEKSRGSGGGNRNRFIYTPPLPLQPSLTTHFS